MGWSEWVGVGGCAWVLYVYVYGVEVLSGMYMSLKCVFVFVRLPAEDVRVLMCGC